MYFFFYVMPPKQITLSGRDFVHPYVFKQGYHLSAISLQQFISS